MAPDWDEFTARARAWRCAALVGVVLRRAQPAARHSGAGERWRRWGQPGLGAGADGVRAVWPPELAPERLSVTRVLTNATRDQTLPSVLALAAKASPGEKGSVLDAAGDEQDRVAYLAAVAATSRPASQPAPAAGRLARPRLGERHQPRPGPNPDHRAVASRRAAVGEQDPLAERVIGQRAVGQHGIGEDEAGDHRHGGAGSAMRPSGCRRMSAAQAPAARHRNGNIAARRTGTRTRGRGRAPARARSRSPRSSRSPPRDSSRSRLAQLTAWTTTAAMHGHQTSGFPTASTSRTVLPSRSRW